MKLGTSYLVEPTRNPWPKVAVDLGLDAGALVDRARQMAHQAPDALADAAARAAVDKSAASFSSRLVDLVAERVRRCERAFGG